MKRHVRLEVSMNENPNAHSYMAISETVSILSERGLWHVTSNPDSEFGYHGCHDRQTQAILNWVAHRLGQEGPGIGKCPPADSAENEELRAALIGWAVEECPVNGLVIGALRKLARRLLKQAKA